MVDLENKLRGLRDRLGLCLVFDYAFFQPGLGRSVSRSLGRTWIAGGFDCRLLDRLG